MIGGERVQRSDLRDRCKIYADVMKIGRETASERLARFDLMSLVKNN